MSKLSELRGKCMPVKIGGIEFELYPLDLDELAEFAELQEKKDTKESLKFLIRKTLKKSIPDVVDDEITHLAPNYQTELVEKIIAVNGLKGDASKKSDLA